MKKEDASPPEERLYRILFCPPEDPKMAALRKQLSGWPVLIGAEDGHFYCMPVLPGETPEEVAGRENFSSWFVFRPGNPFYQLFVELIQADDHRLCLHEAYCLCEDFVDFLDEFAQAVAAWARETS